MVAKVNINFIPMEFNLGDKELGTWGAEGIDVQLIEIEEFEDIELVDELSYDMRLTHLSLATRCEVQRLFGGDVDEAQHRASQLVNTYRLGHAPLWANEVHGLHRAGWKHPGKRA
jgi:hypothetical protein